MNQLPRLSPAVGGGLPGLPKRKNTNGLVDYALFDINVAVSTTEYRQVPFHVPNYSQLSIFWQGRYDGVNVSVVHELIPYPSNGSGVINCQNDLAGGGADYEITYEASTNRIKIVTGITLGAKGSLRALLYDRQVRQYASITDPGSASEAILPFPIANMENVYIGVNSGSWSASAIWPIVPIAAANTNSWHINAINQNRAFKITSKNTFIRDSSGALGAGDVYLIEFQ